MQEKQENVALAEFIASIDSYAPTMPEAVVEYYLKTAGVNTTDPRIAKVIALATDRFLASVVNDAKQRALLKQQRTGEEEPPLRLAAEDVVASLRDRNIVIMRDL